jgi:thymidylate synthase
MNLHIYDRHFDNARELLKRTGQVDEPLFFLDVPDGTDFYNICASDFVLSNYHPVKPQLKFELAE